MGPGSKGRNGFAVVLEFETMWHTLKLANLRFQSFHRYAVGVRHSYGTYDVEHVVFADELGGVFTAFA